MKKENFANLSVNMKLPESTLKLLKGMESRSEWTNGILDITFAKTGAPRKPKFRGETTPKTDWEDIPDKLEWVRSPDGNEFYGIPVREDGNGKLWVGDGNKAVKIREDTDEDFLGVELPDGRVVEKILQAPKWVKVNGKTVEVWKDYKQLWKYCQIITSERLYVSPNLSMSGKKVQSIKEKENNPIVNVDFPTAMYLASRVGYGEWESKLMYDAEYSLDWIYQVYVKGDRSAMNNEYYLWLQTKINDGSPRVFARSVYGDYDEDGIRGWASFIYCNSDITIRASLKRNTETKVL